MSSFKCPTCGADIVEGEGGHYVTGCEHWPLERRLYKELAENAEPMSPDIIALVNKYFWDIVDAKEPYMDIKQNLKDHDEKAAFEVLVLQEMVEIAVGTMIMETVSKRKGKINSLDEVADFKKAALQLYRQQAEARVRERLEAAVTCKKCREVGK